MIKTTYYCDICKKEVDGNKLLPYYEFGTVQRTMDICLDCYRSLAKTMNDKVKELKCEEE